MEQKTHWRRLFDNTYLRAELLDEGEVKVLTIKNVEVKEVVSEKGKDELPVLIFAEADVLPMVVNKINCKTIQKLYGPYIEDWIGKRIQVFSTSTKVAGEITPCLRIKPTVPTSNAPEYKCTFCGKTMDKETYEKTVKSFGKPYCCKECYDKDVNTKNLL